MAKSLIRRNSGYKGMKQLINKRPTQFFSNNEEMNNSFIADNFFKNNPSKVLGKQSTRKGRYGDDIIVVEGNIDAIQKIDAIPVLIVDSHPHQNYTTIEKAEIIERVFETDSKQTKEKKIKRLRAGTDQPIAVNQETYSFQEIHEMYNKNITRDELEAYYFTHPELNYKLLFDKFVNSKKDLLRKGLICWTATGFVYTYTYQSGNIGKKISELKRDKDRLVAEIGQSQYDLQYRLLHDIKPKAKGFLGDERIILLPHSNFAKEQRIEELKFGKPELHSQMSLFSAFRLWLLNLPADNFKKSTGREIVDFYLDNKAVGTVDKDASPLEKEKQEKFAINTKQRTKEEGDELFARFLAEELLPEDQAEIAFLWNEKFNTLVEPNLTKIPVCFSISKTFKQGPLLLNPTQRQAAAFIMEKYSGLFAYGVGVGKTMADMVCISQAWYNGLAKKFLLVVPTNTYEKWIGELQGYTDKKTGTFMHGALPQLPPVQGIYNLNPTIVKEKLKKYSRKDELHLQSIEDAISFLKKLDVDYLNEVQKKSVKHIYSINFVGIEPDYNNYLSLTKSASPKTFREFVIDFLKDEYNYYVYALGEIKPFPDGTIFVTTEIGLQRLGVKQTEELETHLFKILSQGEEVGFSEREIAGLELKIKQTISSSQKNAKLFVEDFGFDFLTFDEAHYYKKVFTHVKGNITGKREKEDGNIKYQREKSKYEIKSGSYPSARALSAFVLSHYIQLHNNNRNVIQLTATPFTNSPLEVFSMLTLTNYKALQELGLHNIVDFFDTFMRINYDIKYTPQKTVVKDVVLTGYNNLSQLRQVIYSLMDKKDEGANLKRPTMITMPSVEKGIETTLPMTAEQTELMQQVKQYIQGKADYSDVCREALIDELENTDFDGLDDETLINEWERITGKEFEGEREDIPDSRKETMIKQIKNANTDAIELDVEELNEEESLGVRILRGLSMMRQITLSPFLYHKACRKAAGQAPELPNYKEYIETSPKLQYAIGCIRSVIDYHKSKRQKISGQVIYMNAGVEYFPLIKQYLIREVNLKESEVGIVSGGMSKTAKENIKNRFLSGDILVLIGSATISVGVDLQNNASTLYNLYYDWNPTDAQQIAGRIYRQGNRFAFVRIVYPQCYNSADPVIFEYLNQKTLRINEIWNKSSVLQELDLRDFDPKALQKKLITDPEEKADWEILEESEKVGNQVIYLENRRENLENAIHSYRSVVDLRPKIIQYLNDLSFKKMQAAKQTAIANQKEKVNEIVEKYGEDADKMAAEIAKYKNARYDYERDPEGKFIVTDYNELGDEKIYADAKKYIDIIDKWVASDESIWKELYGKRFIIEDELSSFRNHYKYMKMAEAVTLQPLGLTFETAQNPVADFNMKLQDLRDQLKTIQSSKEQRIERIRKEMAAQRVTLTTTQDRIKQFAEDNEKYLDPQLVAGNTEPIQMPRPAFEETMMEVADQKLTKIKVSKSGIKKFRQMEAVPPSMTPEQRRKSIEKQINALQLARKFSADKNKIDKQINALSLSLKFVA